MPQDLLDHPFLLDAGDELYLAPAPLALRHLDPEDSLQTPSCLRFSSQSIFIV
jgi:hypothetical protein